MRRGHLLLQSGELTADHGRYRLQIIVGHPPCLGVILRNSPLNQ
jgi:hypothetical protein